jgi:hypothetical protein
MVETEREILREKDEEAKLGERKPFESSRQAEYEDSVAPADDWQYEDTE